MQTGKALFATVTGLLLTVPATFASDVRGPAVFYFRAPTDRTETIDLQKVSDTFTVCVAEVVLGTSNPGAGMHVVLKNGDEPVGKPDVADRLRSGECRHFEGVKLLSIRDDHAPDADHSFRMFIIEEHGSTP